MSTQLITIGFFLFSLLVTAQAQPVQLLATTENSLTLEFSLPPFEQETQLNDESLECQQIHIPLWSKESDQTKLPITGTLLQVPDSGNIQIKVIASHFETLSPFIPCISEVNTLFPTDLVEIEPRAIWRDVPVARLIIRPFQWQPLTQELYYFTHLQIQVEFEKSVTLDRVVRNKIRTDIYDNIFQNTLINYQAKARIVRENADRSPSTETFVRNSPPTRLSKQFDSFRITIKQEGLYRIFYEDLVQNGLNPTLINPSNLQLSNHGQAVAIKVVTQQAGSLQPGDYLEFYAAGLDNRFTGTDVYWLHWNRPGQRITQVDGTVTGQESLVTAFYERLHLEENHELWEMTPGAPQQDYFFWSRFNADGTPLIKAYLVEAPAAVTEETKAFNVRVAFQGRSNPANAHPNHHTLLYWNETLIDDEHWDGDVAYLQETRADSTLLKEENSLLIMTPGDTGATVDIVYLNWMEVEYWRQFIAVNDRLKFNLRNAERTRIEVDGFSQADIKIYDITNPHAISEIINFTVIPNGQFYKVIFADEAPEGKIYYVTTISQLQRPTDLFAWKTNYLNSTKNGADYILITVQEFLSAVEPLRILRQKQGWRVQVVSVEQIYDEFNQGVLDPVAIKNFLKYAYENWSPPAPSYVFLVGDANTDYRQYLGGDKKSRIPVHLSNDSVARVTPDDNWYVTVEGDDVLPEMMIGRIPGDTPTTVARNIDKIVRYELFALPSPHKVLLIADGKEEYEIFNENLFNNYIQPAGFEADRVYTRLYLGSEVSDSIALRHAAEDIRSSLDQHVMLANYVGHGAVAQWGFSKKFFGMLDVEWLNNIDKLAFVLALTCGNGYPSLPIIYSFADQFVMATYKGAIAYFSSSSLSQPIGNEMLSNEVFSRIFQQGDRRLGSITMQSKVAAYSKGVSENVMRIYTLFGDPAVVLKD